MRKSDNTVKFLKLKTVNMDSIFSSYEKGDFKEVKIMKKNTIPIVIGKNNSIFKKEEINKKFFSNKNGDLVISGILNDSVIKTFKITGSMFSDDRKKTCEYCLLRFKYKHSSYPVSMKEIELLDTVNNKFTIVYKFDVDGIFCSLECALGYLELVNIDNKSKYISYLFAFHNVIYPGKSLKPANNPRLLKENGGNLDRDVWSVDNYVFKETNRMFCLPVRREFLEKKFIKK